MNGTPTIRHRVQHAGRCSYDEAETSGNSKKDKHSAFGGCYRINRIHFRTSVWSVLEEKKERILACRNGSTQGKKEFEIEGWVKGYSSSQQETVVSLYMIKQG